MLAVINCYVFAKQKRKAQKWHGCQLLFQPKPAVWAARALAKLKLGRICSISGESLALCGSIFVNIQPSAAFFAQGIEAEIPETLPQVKSRNWSG
jgi:hypothetical protein